MLGPLFGLITIYLLVQTLETQKHQVDSANMATEDALKLQLKQQALMSRQSFEQTFFAWMHSYRDLVNRFAYSQRHLQPIDNSLMPGVPALMRLWSEHMSVSYLEPRENSEIPKGSFSHIELEKNVGTRVEQLCAQHAIAKAQKMLRDQSQSLDSMFNTLKRLIQWVDEQPEIDWRQKHTYIAILRAQVSTTELKFIFYFSLSQNGETLLSLVNKYGFLSDAMFNERLFGIVRCHLPGIFFLDSAFNEELALTADSVRYTP